MMELATFMEMLNDKHLHELKRLEYKYGRENTLEFVSFLKGNFYKELPIKDFNGNNIVYLPIKVQIIAQLEKSLLKNIENDKYAVESMEDEAKATLEIEGINTERESIRKILSGGAPENESEKKIFGIKKGFDFIRDKTNKITEHNLYKLYTLSIGDCLDEENALKKGCFYRHDSVYVKGADIIHEGINHELLPGYMQRFMEFINAEDEIDQVIKSIIIHYYTAYLHPYFDGNGRMARLLSLWYLVGKGYNAALFIPFSQYINKSKGKYYSSFQQIEQNLGISGVCDTTPFIDFFIENVLRNAAMTATTADFYEEFNELLRKGIITPKEKELFDFVASRYGIHEFSTKQLEKDFRDAAYATIRSFVMKLERYGIFISINYANRRRYKLKKSP
jgi:Fic family protein